MIKRRLANTEISAMRIAVERRVMEQKFLLRDYPILLVIRFYGVVEDSRECTNITIRTD